MIAMLVAAMGFAQFQKMETSPFKKQVIYKQTREANGISLVSVTPADGATLEAGNITISGTVQNNGDETLTSYKVSYTVDDGDAVVYAVSEIEVANGESHNFTHATPAELAAGNHTIVVTVTEPNGDTETTLTGNSMEINVTVSEPAQDVVEIALTSVTPEDNATVTAGNVTISGVVTNNGNVALTSYKVSYKINDADPVVSTVTIDEAVAAAGTHTFSLTVALEASETPYEIIVTVSEPNGVADGNAEDNSKTIHLTATAPVPPAAVAITLAVTPTEATANVGDSITFTGTVTNTGTDALTTYKFSYTIDTLAAVDSTVTGLNIATDSTNVFSFTVVFEEAGAHTVVVTASEPNSDTEFTALTQTINVTVSEPVPDVVEIALTSVSPANNETVIAGDITITGVVTNNGNVALSSYKVSYTVDNAEAVESTITIDEAVAAAGTHTFTLTVAIEAGEHTIVVAVSEPNGVADSIADNSKTITINAIDCSTAHTAPWAETFAVNSETLNCWTIINANGDDKTFSLMYADEEETDLIAAYAYSATNAANDWLISPKLSIGENQSVRFNVANTGYEEKYKVWLITESPSNYENATLLQDETTANARYGEFDNVTINMSAYNGQVVYIGIQCVSAADQYYFIVDNFELAFTPTTPEIALTSVTPATGASVIAGQSINISGVVTNNGVDLTSYKVSYTVDGGDAVEYAVSGINVAWGGTHNFAHSTPVVLETAGAHTIVVTVSNPNGTADNTNDNSMTITLNAVSCDPISEFPYEEGFENGIPECWTLIDADGDGHNWMAISDFFSEDASDYVHGGSNAAISQSYENYVGAYDANNWMITSAINIPENGVCVASWYAASLDTEYPDSYSVYIGTEPTVANMTANQAVLSHTADEWEMKSVSLEDYAGQTIYIAFNHRDNDNYVLLIDDFSITYTTSVEESIAETIAVYPNPTSSMVTIANAEGKDIIVVNSLGQVVASIENAAANQTIDVANFANGTYFVKVDGEVVKLNVVK